MEEMDKISRNVVYKQPYSEKTEQPKKRQNLSFGDRDRNIHNKD